MKQKTFLFTTLFLMAFAMPVLAHEEVEVRVEGGPIKARIELQDRRANVAERRAEIKADFKTRTASSTERKAEFVEAMGKKAVERTAKIFLATIERLEKILARLNSRIEKHEAEGEVIVGAEEHAVSAGAHLSNARKNLEAFTSINLSDSTIRENFAEIREAALEVKADLKLAHEEMMNSVKELK